MNNRYDLLYIDPDRVPDRLPDGLERIDDWLWRHTALARWAFADRKTVTEESVKSAQLIVLAWPADSQDVEKVYQAIRSWQPQATLFILRDAKDRPEATKEFKALHAGAHILLVDEVSDERKDRLDKLMAKWLESLPLPDFDLGWDENDPIVKQFLQWIEQSRLELVIRKYFPDEKSPEVFPVGGGWSEAKLCRVTAGDPKTDYFLKFFDRSERFLGEFRKHNEACLWLGDATVKLRRIPELGPAGEGQLKAFPPEKPPLFPVCYESATAAKSGHRDTLKRLYLDKPDQFIEDATASVLNVLQANQKLSRNPESLWSLNRNGDFHRGDEMKRIVLGALDDLDGYGAAMCTGWASHESRIEDFVYRRLPGGLQRGIDVLRGHIHGDPNSRNCLVDQDDPGNLQLIDCGGYRSDGRLVSDLAIIERDLKFVLLGTEANAAGFRDLDAAALPKWCTAEADSVRRLLDYTRDYARASLANEPSLRRAYCPVGLVRQAAKKVSVPFDPPGYHYFAALLYWTLDVLKEPAVRRTKKLLALFSAAEILEILK